MGIRGRLRNIPAGASSMAFFIRTGGAWRMMPNDLPHWKTCYHYFRLWAKQGVWLRIHDSLRDMARLALGKKSPDRCDPR